jgi:hypothetical protein
MRQSFWELIAANKKKEKDMDPITQNELFTKLTIKEISDHLGTGSSAIVALKNGTRGASVQMAKKAAQGTSLRSGNVYLSSQLRALEKKLALKQIEPESVLAACLPIMRAMKGSFRSDEIQRDAEFVAAAQRLREIAEAALDTYGAGSEYSEPVTDTNSSVTAVAAKSSRDLHGKANRDNEEKVERDIHGRAVKS